MQDGVKPNTRMELSNMSVSTVTDYLSPKAVTREFPMLTEGNLAQRRFKGLPPVYLKPTSRTVIYRRQDIIDWIEGSERTGTAEGS